MKQLLRKSLSLALSLALALSLCTVAFAASVAVTGISLNQSSATLVLNGDSAGKTITLSATISPDNATNQNVSWRSNKTSVATVNSSGVVTAVAEGTATITATTSDGGYSATCSVSVVENYVTDVSITPAGPGTLTVGDTASLSAQVTYKRTNDNPRGVSWTSTDTSVATVSSSGKVTAVSAGTATLTATAKDQGNNGTTVADTYKLTVSDDRISLSQKSLNLMTGESQNLTYTLKTASTVSPVWTSDDTTVAKVDGGRVTGVKAGTAVITVNVGGAQASCTVTVLDSARDTLSLATRTESRTVGQNTPFTLALPALTIKNGTADVSGNYTLSYLWTGGATVLSTQATVTQTLTAAASQTYTCQVTATSKSDGTKTMTTQYSVTVTALPTVTASLSVAAGSAAVTLGSVSSATPTSVRDQISAAVSGLTTVTFDVAKAVSTASCGTFSAAAGTAYAYDPAAGSPLAAVTFTPAPTQSGTYTVPFTAVGAATYYGTLTVTVTGGTIPTPTPTPTVPTLAYTTDLVTPVALKESDFTAWYKASTGYTKLNYIVLTGTSNYAGVYKNNGSAFPAASTAIKFYTSDTTGDATSSYLKNITYQSTTPETVTLRFTAYGGNAAGDANAKTGTATFTVTKGSVAAVSFDVTGTTPVTLSETELLNAYKTAMGVTGSFSIRLLTLPAKGTLYDSYNADTKTGVALTASNLSQYVYAINQSSAARPVNLLTYVPAGTSTGADSVTYAAVNADGATLYTGTIRFQYLAASGDTMTRTCASDGYSFAGSDFYNSNDADPVVSLVFSKPSSGWLFRGFENGSGVMDEGASYYTDSASNGQYHVSTLTYVPRAGFSGTATISVTMTTKSGKTVGKVLQIKVTSKTISDRFTDVTTDNVGTWAADSIDFAYQCGLVNGTSAKSFSPSMTMNRAMLVTVLYRAAGTPEVVTTTRFTDVAKTDYYYKAVLWANVMGIVNGTSDTTFSPNTPITREQIATILYRYASVMSTGTTFFKELSGYDDINDVSAYAVEGMTWAVDRGIVTGTTAKTLSPLNQATRAQVAVMLHRYLTY